MNLAPRESVLRCRREVRYAKKRMPSPRRDRRAGWALLRVLLDARFRAAPGSSGSWSALLALARYLRGRCQRRKWLSHDDDVALLVGPPGDRLGRDTHRLARDGGVRVPGRVRDLHDRRRLS